MASTYLTRTQTAGNRRKGTFSAWFKKVNLSYQYLMSWNSTTSGTSYGDWIRFNGEQLDILKYTGSVVYRVQTNRLFRDTSAWYHLVVAYDSEQATASNRIKIYVNGVQETSFNESTYPSQNFDFQFNNNNIVACVGKNYNTEANFDGSMSHVHFIDGTAYDASAFGETDATTGEWKGKTSPSVTYGTNGFFILKDGNGITDQSGEGNDFTLGGGTLTDLKDNPDNVFATINNLVGSNLFGSTVNFSNGNTTVEDPSGSASGVNPYFMSTLAMPSKGKFYCELKPSSFSTGSGHGIGIFRTSSGNTADVTSSSNQIRYIFADTSIYISKYGSTDQSGLTAISSGDIVGMALDLDNGTFQYYVNGVARGSQITGVSSANDGYDYFFFANLESSSSGRYGKYEWNFGNGYFGTTAITTNSGNGYSGAEGSSKFNYTVPTGYSALSTKGLNE